MSQPDHTVPPLVLQPSKAAALRGWAGLCPTTVHLSTNVACGLVDPGVREGKGSQSWGQWRCGSE